MKVIIYKADKMIIRDLNNIINLYNKMINNLEIETILYLSLKN
jgi:hypothetical protein